MVRQYNFYMGREDEELFLKYLKQNQKDELMKILKVGENFENR